MQSEAGMVDWTMAAARGDGSFVGRDCHGIGACGRRLDAMQPRHCKSLLVMDVASPLRGYDGQLGYASMARVAPLSFGDRAAIMVVVRR